MNELFYETKKIHDLFYDMIYNRINKYLNENQILKHRDKLYIINNILENIFVDGIISIHTHKNNLFHVVNNELMIYSDIMEYIKLNNYNYKTEPNDFSNINKTLNIFFYYYAINCMYGKNKYSKTIQLLIEHKN